MNNLPDNFIPAVLNDFVSIDKDKNWTWRVGLQFAIHNSQNEYELYTTPDWNEARIYDPDIEKPDKRTMFVMSQNRSFEKGNALCGFLDAELCFINIKDKYIKPLTKAEFKKKIVSEFTDF